MEHQVGLEAPAVLAEMVAVLQTTEALAELAVPVAQQGDHTNVNGGLGGNAGAGVTIPKSGAGGAGGSSGNGGVVTFAAGANGSVAGVTGAVLANAQQAGSGANSGTTGPNGIKGGAAGLGGKGGRVTVTGANVAPLTTTPNTNGGAAFNGSQGTGH